jgi:hypothetical protein
MLAVRPSFLGKCQVPLLSITRVLILVGVVLSSCASGLALTTWCSKQAQMSPSRKRSGPITLLSQGLSVFVPGPNKTQAQKLLTGLVEKYQVAIGRMKAMPLYPETEKAAPRVLPVF